MFELQELAAIYGIMNDQHYAVNSSILSVVLLFYL